MEVSNSKGCYFSACVHEETPMSGNYYMMIPVSLFLVFFFGCNSLEEGLCYLRRGYKCQSMRRHAQSLTAVFNRPADGNPDYHNGSNILVMDTTHQGRLQSLEVLAPVFQRT